MRRIALLSSVAALCVVGAAQAAVHHRRTTRHAQTSGLSAPGPLAPANGARVAQLPALTWNAVRGAAEYQYQVAADPRFRSLIVVNASAGKGTPATHNLAASLEKPVADGTYYWRVRGVSAAKRPGPWSSTRSLVKAWTQAPQLLGPTDGGQINWPSTPLVLHWSEVPYAFEYIVTIATDRALANIVVGSPNSPVKTEATVFALQNTLQAGQTYYWAITPIDARGHHGAQSRVRSFTWSWPTTTTTSVTPLNESLGTTELNWTPEFTWNPVPGAARYQVEVSAAEGFPPGSIWCCSGTTIGTSASPLLALKDNRYYWRVRAIDANGNAGVWNEGPSFTKSFDPFTPGIPQLGTVDIHEQPTPVENPTTETPIVKWSPVPGAASYEVQLAPVEGGGCGNFKKFVTSSPAWTPLANGGHIEAGNWPNPQGDDANLKDGTTYCVRVGALTDRDAFGGTIESNLETLAPAFTYETRHKRCVKASEDEARAEKYEKEAEEAATQAEREEDEEKAKAEREAANAIYDTYEYLSKAACAPIISQWDKLGATPAPAYLLPQATPASTRTPLFTWQPAPGASSYYVVIARDSAFKDVADVAATYGTAYAPPVGGEEPLPDETTKYYWEVLPVNSKGQHLIYSPANPHASFNKSSVPPTPLAPKCGDEVLTQPTFKWTPAEGALNYTIQVATDPTFSRPIDNEQTDSTSFTSSSTYPAHETLYWHVRANDTNPHHEGLNWSPMCTFKRTLAVPTPLPSNPTSSQTIPVLAWSPVTGAVGYEVFEESPDGKAKGFTVRSPAESASLWAGPGIWHWRVRALFPTAMATTVPGGYSEPQSLSHTAAPPSGATGVKSGTRIVISWDPQAYAKQYAVAISTNESFSSLVLSQKTTQTSWAPDVDLTKSANRGTLYWRVAAVDSRGNFGPYATGSFVAPKARCKTKRVKRRGKTVRVCVAAKHGKKKRH